ncbi:MAG: carbohydrate ABC transporter permease [Anaerolineae bacterium]
MVGESASVARVEAVRAVPGRVGKTRWQAQATRFAWKAALNLIAWAGTVFFLAPFLWMVSSSLKSDFDIRAVPPQWIPRHPMWHNYINALLGRWPFPHYALNTTFITVTATAGTVLAASLVAYSFARLRWRGRDTWFIILLSTMMLPGQVTLVPVYYLFSVLGWVNTWAPLIVPSFFGGGAFNIFLARQYFMTITTEMDDAARIDGCSFFNIYWRIILPMSKPILATIAIFSFFGHWNDFFGPLIYISSKDKFTLALALYQYRAIQERSYGQMNYLMAASVAMMMPCLITYFLAQKLFIQGIVLTGVKG